jgi:hypothetical protein
MSGTTVAIEGWWNGYQTWEVNFAPAQAVAQASPAMTPGGGLQLAGIVAYRYQRGLAGAEESIHYGAWTGWRDCVWGDRLTSVTFGVATGSNKGAARPIGNLVFG